MIGKASNWRVALALGVAMGISGMLVIPYVLALTGKKMDTADVPVPVAYAISGAQGTVLGFLLAWAGLAMGRSVGLDAPLVRAWVGRTTFDGPRRWGAAIVTGALAGGAILGLDATCFAKVVAAVPGGVPHVAWWQGALASFYGGIGEEVQVRLFFMTAIAWLLAKLSGKRAAGERPPAWVFIAALIVSALAFGAGHLPATAMVFGSLTPIVVTRTVLLNTVGGLAFGAVYWRWGLEHAMVAHFAGDVVLHVISGG
jgi:membrane protease YdiL (CAAX protease family)